MPTDLLRSERDRSLDTLSGQVRELWRRQSGWRRLLGAGILVALAGALAWTALAPRESEWVLATKIRQERQGLVAAALLDEAAIPVRRRGEELLVPASSLAVAHRLLAANPEALASAEPAGGWGRVLGEGPSPKAQLERELADSLMRVTAVRAARVHLSFGRKSPFRERATPPSASVLLHLHDGVSLAPAQVEGIRELVARGIEGASPKEVSVLDQQGRSLVAAEPSAQQARAALEAECNAKVRAVLEPVLGSGRVVSVATVELATATSAGRTRVAVLVDPAPRGEARAEELERWTQLARDAAGIDETRGDALTLELARFAPGVPAQLESPRRPEPPAAAATTPAPSPGLEPDWRLLALAAAALALAAMLLAGLGWLRVRRYRRLLSARVPPAAATPAPHVLDAVPPSSRLDRELSRAAHVLGADPEATAMVLSSWLTAEVPQAPLQRRGVSEPGQ